MKISVLGAGGFIGSALTARLVAEGHSVKAVDAKPPADWWQRSECHNLQSDLRDSESAMVAVQGAEWVYDLAEDMGGVQWLEANRSAGLASFRIVLNVTEACEKAGVERLWFASSACAYPTHLQDDDDLWVARTWPGGHASAGLAESDAWPAQPEKGYGEAKLLGERLCEYYQAEGRMETRVGRYHAIFGPHGSWTGGREKSPAAVCRKVAEAVVSGCHEIEIWGDGRQQRSFCYIDDCLDATQALMASDHSEPLNIGTDRSVTIDELVTLVEKIAGVTLERRYDLSAPQGVRSRNADLTRVREILGWEPQVPLEDGLARLYPWVLEQTEKARLV
ncbi:MAG: NAD-dependent epimerase/dehydratase family protein [Pseudomonadota bacterium]